MNVTIRFFAVFGELLGKSMTIKIGEGTSVFRAINTIAKKNEKGYAAIFDESEQLREFVIIMRNGRRLSHTDAMSTLLTEGDEIAVFPPVAGG
ncbi:MAG TPA: ubiquitin-like small modifier protein 1 [Methanoregulaceae archaeon]|nr:ubiquitin-like small modifier protein 1 [Methanoregulaceae archaeon]